MHANPGLVVLWTAIVLSALAATAGAAVPVDAARTEAVVQPDQASGLEIGSPAPQLAIKTWVKGDPVTFEQSKVYVVEFWATWCAPCRRAIPLLSSIQQELGPRGVTVVGIASQEHKGLPDLEQFVQRQGERINYAIAWDAEGRTDRDWMVASRSEGIPTAFIVDQQGRIAWIGHPAVGLMRTLGKLLDGTFDIQVEAVLARRAREIRAKTQPLAAAFEDARRAGDHPKALSIVDEILRLDPRINGEWTLAKLELLAVDMKEPERGYIFARQCVESSINENAEDLLNIAWFILEEPGLKSRDTALALEAARRAEELAGDMSPVVQMVLARALSMTGDKQGAVSRQQRAVQLSEPGAEREAQSKRLEEYVRKAAE
jgi:thiol-disulfide isomerase/thioredoxin